MSVSIIYDDTWLRNYTECLREERALINEIICSLNAARYSVDINSLPELLEIQSEMEHMERGISIVIDALRDYQYGADYASWILKKSILQIELPALLI